MRRLGNYLLQEGPARVHLFLTHTHWDHILGFPFFKPLFESDTEILPLAGLGSEAGCFAVYQDQEIRL